MLNKLFDYYNTDKRFKQTDTANADTFPLSQTLKGGRGQKIGQTMRKSKSSRERHPGNK